MFGVYTGYSYHTIISNTVPQPVQHCEIQRETGKPSALNFGICSISVYIFLCYIYKDSNSTYFNHWIWWHCNDGVSFCYTHKCTGNYVSKFNAYHPQSKWQMYKHPPTNVKKETTYQQAQHTSPTTNKCNNLNSLFIKTVSVLRNYGFTIASSIHIWKSVWQNLWEYLQAEVLHKITLHTDHCHLWALICKFKMHWWVSTRVGQ